MRKPRTHGMLWMQEKASILGALKACKCNVAEAAKLAGLSERQVRYRLAEYGLRVRVTERRVLEPVPEGAK
jgi:transcriptional regulator with GAF, ATPase, and Fis domain